MNIKAKKCKCCNGDGYIIVGGTICKKKRHLYTKPNGKPSKKCLYCGNPNPYIKRGTK